MARLNLPSLGGLHLPAVAGLAERILPRRRPAPAARRAEAPDEEPYFSVLDAGSGAVKALVVRSGAGEAAVLAATSRPVAAAPEGAPPALEPLVAAAEAALVAAEDAAGVVPRRVVMGVRGAGSIISCGVAQATRARPSPIRREELAPLVARAERMAQAAARRQFVAEFPDEPDLDPVNAAFLAAAVDGRPVADPVGLSGQTVGVTLGAAFSPNAEVRRVVALAETLDLELAGVICLPFALGGVLGPAPNGPALLVDVGAESTTVVLAGAGGAEAAAALPLGAAGLEARLAAELGTSLEEAQAHLAAHAVGAGPRRGTALGRVVRRLAEHHAGVWLDAFQVACGRLVSQRELPSRILLCGGGGGLPELRRGLADTAWQVGLAFQLPPAVRLLALTDMPRLSVRENRLPALQAVPSLCVAALAGGAVVAPTRLDPLLRQQLAAPGSH